jgi:hypothetical protein
MMIVHAEDPQRAAGAIVTLAGVRASMGPGGAWTVGEIARVLPRANSAPSGIARLLLHVDASVEEVIGIACAQGFHAGELGRSGIMEFWIDEHLLVELVTAEARISHTLAA